jgi:hypothetical protein
MSLAALLVSIGRTINYSRNDDASRFYLLSALLGVRATERTGTDPEDLPAWDLLVLNSDLVTPERRKYSARWLARFVGLMAFLFQVCTALVLGIDRWRKGLQYLGAFDGWNILYLLGGAVVGFQSLVIHICNTDWKCRAPSAARRSAAESAEPSVGYFSPIRRRIMPVATIVETNIAFTVAQVFFIPAWRTTVKILLPLYMGAMIEGFAAPLNVLPLFSLTGQFLTYGITLVAVLLPLIGALLARTGLVRVWAWSRWFQFIWSTALWVTLYFVAMGFALDLLDMASCFVIDEKRCTYLSWKDPRDDRVWGL